MIVPFFILQPTTKLFIDGKFVESKTEEWIPLYNPVSFLADELLNILKSNQKFFKKDVGKGLNKSSNQTSIFDPLNFLASGSNIFHGFAMKIGLPFLTFQKLFHFYFLQSAFQNFFSF